MNRVLSSCLVSVAGVALAFSGLGSSAHAQDLNGYWDVRTPNANGDGTFRDTFFHIEQNGEAISGELIRRPNGIPITGTFKDGAIALRHRAANASATATGAPPRNATFPASHVRRHVRRRQAHAYDAAAAWAMIHSVGEKVTKEATEPPAALPLPALNDVPDNGLARTPPMGWNSWNKFAGRVDDAAVRGMADAMVSSGMSEAGYVYVNIDDTWERAATPTATSPRTRSFRT